MLLTQATYWAQQIEGCWSRRDWPRVWRVIAIVRKSDDPTRMEFCIVALHPNGTEHTINTAEEWRELKARFTEAKPDASETGLTCRSCGNTGRMFTGQWCVCPTGMRLARMKEAE